MKGSSTLKFSSTQKNVVDPRRPSNFVNPRMLSILVDHETFVDPQIVSNLVDHQNVVDPKIFVDSQFSSTQKFLYIIEFSMTLKMSSTLLLDIRVLTYVHMLF